MQLTQFTDFALRVLIYLTQKEDGFATISEVAEFYGISRNHLVKIVHHLSTHEVLHTVRGKSGGMRLARPAAEIVLGDVVRLTEPSFDVVECFDKKTNRCIITPQCRLQSVLHEASRAFLAVLDNYTLADAVWRRIDIQAITAARLSDTTTEA